jgi:hypothetical protein
VEWEISYVIRRVSLLAKRRAETEAYVQLVQDEPKERAMKPKDTNHGEGNPEAAAEFNKAEQAFVNSPKGKDKIAQGPQVRPDEEAALIQAEQRAKAHGKNDDSKTTKMK